MNNPVQNIRCPNCFERLLTLALTQNWERETIWVCRECHQEYETSQLTDHTPQRTIPIINEKELTRWTGLMPQSKASELHQPKSIQITEVGLQNSSDQMTKYPSTQLWLISLLPNQVSPEDLTNISPKPITSSSSQVLGSLNSGILDLPSLLPYTNSLSNDQLSSLSLQVSFMPMLTQAYSQLLFLTSPINSSKALINISQSMKFAMSLIQISLSIIYNSIGSNASLLPFPNYLIFWVSILTITY